MASLGYEMTLSVGGQTIGKARNVDLEMTKDVVDITTRDNSGWKGKTGALKEWKVSVEQLYISTNVGLRTIMAAFMNDTEVTVILTDEESNTHTGTAIVASVKRGEPLADAVTLQCELEGNGALVDTLADS